MSYTVVFTPEAEAQLVELYDLDSEYLNVFETRIRTPFFQDAYVDGVRVQLILGPTGSGKTRLIMQILLQIAERGHSAIVYDPACEFVQRFYDGNRGDIILNPLDARCPYWGPSIPRVTAKKFTRPPSCWLHTGRSPPSSAIRRTKW